MFGSPKHASVLCKSNIYCIHQKFIGNDFCNCDVDRVLDGHISAKKQTINISLKNRWEDNLFSLYFT